MMTFIHLISFISMFALTSILGSTVQHSASLNDTEAPTQPVTLTISNVTQTSVELEWSASTDNVAVMAYNIYVDNIFYSSTDELTLSATVTGLTQWTYYSFGVSSLDAAGNESERKFNWYLTCPNCGTTNNWIGGSADWADDQLNWSEGVMPMECQSVLIDNGADVSMLNDVPVNSIFNREYLISTFEVGLNSEFSVESGAEFHVIPSKPGPYSLSGTYDDPDPDCIDPIFCACCRTIGIIDNVNCYYIYQGDIFLPGTYSISGNLLTMSLDPSSIGPNYDPKFRIIDDNTIVELGTADVLTQL